MKSVSIDTSGAKCSTGLGLELVIMRNQTLDKYGWVWVFIVYLFFALLLSKLQSFSSLNNQTHPKAATVSLEKYMN